MDICEPIVNNDKGTYTYMNCGSNVYKQNGTDK